MAILVVNDIEFDKDSVINGLTGREFFYNGIKLLEVKYSGCGLCIFYTKDAPTCASPKKSSEAIGASTCVDHQFIRADRLYNYGLEFKSIIKISI